MRHITVVVLLTAFVLGCSSKEALVDYHQLVDDQAAYARASEKCAESKTANEVMNNPWCQARDKAGTCRLHRKLVRSEGKAPDSEPNAFCPLS